MAQTAQHVHVIDGKTTSFDEKTCPYCHPNGTVPSEKSYPAVYRKGLTVVVQPSKGLMITDTYWKDKNMFLHNTQRMQHDASGKVMIGKDEKPIWQKDTMRLSIPTLEKYIMELSKLVRDIQQQNSGVPQRA
jgi:hypothetical protein